MISHELHAQIRRLFFAEHWRVHTIAAQLGVHHDTVRRAVESERFIRPGTQVRPSALDPYNAFITATLEQYPRLRATRLWAMVRERGYPGSALQVCRYVRTVRPAARAEAFLRLETLAGEQAQVDWGNFGPIRVGATTRLLSCFVLVLSWSRACYARFALDQTLESFLRGHVEAFAALQGVPRTILYDNLKSVVLERVGDHIRFHPHVLELAGHYHFAPQPCAVARGNEKGRVERMIGFLRHAFFAARPFSSVADLNTQLIRWIAEVAHARPVPGRREQRVAEALAEEQPRLLPLPEHPFPCDLLRAVHSGKTPYIRFDGNDYSIPHTLIRRPLTHELRGRDRLRSACPQADAFLDALAVRGHPLASETTRLLRLLDHVGAAALDAALAEALARGAISAASVAHVLEQRRRARRQPPLLDLVLPADPRVRDLRVTPHALSAYDTLLTPPPATPEETPDGCTR